jgi:DNA-binding transcriptional MerR regulator
MSIHDLRPNAEQKSDPEASAAFGEDLYRIGTVTALTGIAAERLRAWERRYGLTPAQKVGKTRYYSAGQLERLKKLKALSDHGHPISSIVELTDSQLEERLAGQRRPAAVAGKTLKFGLIGPNLLVLEQQHASAEDTEIVARWANMAAFCSDQQATGALDVIIVQLPVLLDRHIDTIGRLCPDSRVVAVYQFATPVELAAVDGRGVPTLPWPADWSEIEETAINSAVIPTTDCLVSERRFSDDELIAIAVSAADDPSGCTAYLVDMISQLNAFAEYSEELAATDASRPERFERVHADASQARAQLEMALQTMLGDQFSESTGSLPGIT